eukprot:CAMPEP_0204198602 /NCGR_PEP_ID=MMETSP0361-20130328/65401_1 /ASSEMBLY_ACC=CAM_ASM_000343 /TAXON_ID=268821 /ORGANISM="Scrippsiella Hangoei, Strain SHTV-5" /LENGTH=50 /DNA_ID=CAMNT_0051160747 /DNA_START=83 /DNA_END=231 /DNA_ORIENTATION=-
MIGSRDKPWVCDGEPKICNGESPFLMTSTVGGKSLKLVRIVAEAKAVAHT